MLLAFSLSRTCLDAEGLGQEFNKLLARFLHFLSCLGLPPFFISKTSSIQNLRSNERRSPFSAHWPVFAQSVDDQCTRVYYLS